MPQAWRCFSSAVQISTLCSLLVPFIFSTVLMTKRPLCNRNTPTKDFYLIRGNVPPPRSKAYPPATLLSQLLWQHSLESSPDIALLQTLTLWWPFWTWVAVRDNHGTVAFPQDYLFRCQLHPWKYSLSCQWHLFVAKLHKVSPQCSWALHLQTQPSADQSYGAKPHLYWTRTDMTFKSH
jgi:hypothetical protein